MSRSVKRTPGFCVKNKCVRDWKRFASKAVRNSTDIDDGAAYKRLFDSWNICDCKFLYWSIANAEYWLLEPYGDKVYQAWMK